MKCCRDPEWLHDMMEIFNWSRYLEATEICGIPPECCPHVEDSLELLLPVPCAAEIEWKEGVFWFVHVRAAYGPLLQLSYLGSGEQKEQFWFDSTQRSLHSFGFSKRNSKKVEPPPSVENDKLEEVNYYELMEQQAKNLHAPLLSETFSFGTGFSKADQIKPGLKFEWRNPDDPKSFWGVTVTENKGGFLGLALDSPQLKLTEADFYLFYTDANLFPCGTVSKR